MHIPTDAEEQEAANKLNEHSYANSRVRDKLMDEDLKITKDEVKVSEYVLSFHFFSSF